MFVYNDLDLCSFDSLILRRERSFLHPEYRGLTKNDSSEIENGDLEKVNKLSLEILKDSKNEIKEFKCKTSCISNGSNKKSEKISAALYEKTDSKKNYSIQNDNEAIKDIEEDISLARAEQAAVRVECRDYVGFSELAIQAGRREARAGYRLRGLVAGQPGLGRTSLAATLLGRGEEVAGGGQRGGKEVRGRVGGVELSLLDMPGLESLSRLVDQQLDHYLEWEMRAERDPVQDTRLEFCLYLLPPSTHGVPRPDLEAMRRLASRTNLIPCIARADGLTAEELLQLRAVVRQQLRHHRVRTFQVEGATIAGHRSSIALSVQFSQSEHNQQMPFALVSSNAVVERAGGGGRIRVRRYPWGEVDIDNPDHCDTALLARLLVSDAYHKLKQETHEVHYENYRAKKLSFLAAIDEVSGSLPLITFYVYLLIPKHMESIPNKNPLAILEDDLISHNKKIILMEKEMKEVFNKKIVMKTQELERLQKVNSMNLIGEQMVVDKMRKELKVNETQFIKDSEEFDVQTSSPSHSTASVTSATSSNSKQLFRLNLENFQIRFNKL